MSRGAPCSRGYSRSRCRFVRYSYNKEKKTYLSDGRLRTGAGDFVSWGWHGVVFEDVELGLSLLPADSVNDSAFCLSSEGFCDKKAL